MAINNKSKKKSSNSKVENSAATLNESNGNNKDAKQIDYALVLGNFIDLFCLSILEEDIKPNQWELTEEKLVLLNCEICKFSYDTLKPLVNELYYNRLRSFFNQRKTEIWSSYDQSVKTYFIQVLQKEYNISDTSGLERVLRILINNIQNAQLVFLSNSELTNTVHSETTVNLQKAETKINQLNKQSDDLKKSIEQSKKISTSIVHKTQKKIQEQSKKATETSITILGIFSAIVLVVNAFLSFSGDAINSFITLSPYKGIFVILIFSVVIGNVLLALISVLNKKNEKSDKRCFFFMNALLLIFLLLIVLGCFFDFPAQMNRKVDQKDSSYLYTMEENNTEKTD